MKANQQILILHQLIYQWQRSTITEKAEVVFELVCARVENKPVIGSLVRRIEGMNVQQKTRIAWAFAAVMLSGVLVAIATENWAAGVALALLVGYAIGVGTKKQ